jgi:hypothetical protein
MLGLIRTRQVLYYLTHAHISFSRQLKYKPNDKVLRDQPPRTPRWRLLDSVSGGPNVVYPDMVIKTSYLFSFLNAHPV